MATFIDRTRLSTFSALCSFDLRRHVYPSDVTTPDLLDQYFPQTVTFQGNQQTATVVFSWQASTSGFGTTSWTWSVTAQCTVANGFGATTTTTLTLLSGTGTAGEAATGKSVNVGASTIQFDTSIDYSTIYWDIVESAFGGAGTDYPDISYTCYERATTGVTALSKVTVNGTAVTATGAVGTASNLNHTLVVNWDYYSNNTTAKTFTVSAQSMNSLGMSGMVPTYSHSALGQSTTFTQSSVTGNGLGAPYYGSLSSATVNTSLTFKREVTLRGRIMAFNQSYPDSLTCRVTGFDNLTTGYRDVTAGTGSFDASDSFEKWSVSSTLEDPSGSPSSSSSSRNTVPAWVYADVSSSSLSSLGDDSTNTKMHLRGWHFTGASVQQAQTVAISTGVTTATRTFAGAGVGLNSYRYLRVQVRRTAGTTQTGTISITTQPSSVVKSWDFSTSSGTFGYIYLDLCSPDNKTSTIDETDSPYPRMNPSDTTNAGQLLDGDYWGITRATQIALTGTSVEMGDIHLSSSSGATAWCTGYWAPTRTWTKQKFTSFGGNTQTTNRLFQGDTEGNTQTEEGWALWQTSPASNALMTITDFVADMNATDAGVVRHQGYSATASTSNTSPTYIKNGYANSVTGYAIWLGGVTRKRGQGQKNWFATDQSAGGADVSVTAQTMFRKINGDFVPDAYDAFEQEDAGSQYLSIEAVSYQRGRAHGIVLGTDTDPYALQTVYLRRDSDLSSRGSGSSSTIGTYATGLPMGLGMVNHNTVCGSLDTGDPDPLYTNKQQRAVFKLTSPSGTFVSADRNPLMQHYYATIQSGVVSLWRAANPLAASYSQTITSITGAANLHLRCLGWDPSLGIVLFVEASAGGLTRYYTDTEGASFVSTVINSTGNQPAFCVDDLGLEYYIWRTSGGAIQGKILDANGATIMGVTTLVASSVADSSIDIYERLDDVYIVYSHTTNGITVVRSTDGGRTYS
jgi:hypothetical protein